MCSAPNSLRGCCGGPFCCLRAGRLRQRCAHPARPGAGRALWRAGAAAKRRQPHHPNGHARQLAKPGFAGRQALPAQPHPVAQKRHLARAGPASGARLALAGQALARAARQNRHRRAGAGTGARLSGRSRGRLHHCLRRHPGHRPRRQARISLLERRRSAIHLQRRAQHGNCAMAAQQPPRHRRPPPAAGQRAGPRGAQPQLRARIRQDHRPPRSAGRALERALPPRRGRIAS